MRKMLSELFDEFEKATTKEDRLNILKFNKSPELLVILRMAFHPNSSFIVDKIPDYKPSILPKGMNDKTIAGEVKKLYIWETNNPQRPKNLKKAKSDALLLDLLENLEHGEAKILIGAMTKSLKIRGLNSKLVKEVFPDLLP